MTELSEKQTEQRASLGFQGDWHSDIPIRFDMVWQDQLPSPTFVNPLSTQAASLLSGSLQCFHCSWLVYKSNIASWRCSILSLSWRIFAHFWTASTSGSTIFDMQTSCWRYLWTFGQAEEVLSWCCRSWSKASKNLFHAFFPDCMSLQNRNGLFVETSIQICSVTSFRDDVWYILWHKENRCHASDIQYVKIAPVTSGCRRPFGWCPAATVGGNGTNLDFEWFQNIYVSRSFQPKQTAARNSAHWCLSKVRRLYCCLRKRWPQFRPIQSKLPWSRGWRRTVMWNNLDIFGSKSEDVQTQNCPKLI